MFPSMGCRTSQSQESPARLIPTNETGTAGPAQHPEFGTSADHGIYVAAITVMVSMRRCRTRARLGLWCASACSILTLVLTSGQAPAPSTAAQSIPPQNCAKECHQELTHRKVIHGPAARDCEACHAQGNPEEHKFFLTAQSREELCRRCHTLPHQNVEHAPVREGKCFECHDPHGSDHPHLLVADPKRDLCVRCHTETARDAKFVHGPVAIGACIVCHQPHGSTQPKLLNQDQKGLCLTCHAEVQAKPGMHAHAALEEGCTRCHDPHASNHRFQLVDESPGLCLSCHRERFEQMTAGSKVVHGAITQPGGCTGCHEPHQSRLPKLQRGTEPGICLGCHGEDLKDESGHQLTNMRQLLATNTDHHGPIREGVCTACHNPHAGDHFRLLIEDYPPEFYAPFTMDTFKLCFKCHIPDLVLKPAGRGLTQFRDGDKNLHFLHVNQEKGRTCRACHEVHASKRPAHIREAVPFGSAGWMLEINYERNAQGGSCAPGCHTERAYNRERALNPAPASLGSSGVQP